MDDQIDLTVKKLRSRVNLEGSHFLSLYSKLMKNSQLSEDELVDILRFAILFLRSSDDVVSRLGYRIILQYGEITKDYEPLRAVAQARELIPIVAITERIDPNLDKVETFSDTLFAAHSTNFITVEQDGESLFRTRGQMELRDFNSRDQKEQEAVVVAPTSYGKSEMLIEKVAQRIGSTVCILVPTRALISQTRADVIADKRIRASGMRVLTHPETYTGEKNFIAVMTQERLHRLITDNPELRFDWLLVDEAHNLLANDSRAIEMSQVILTARFRNPSLKITYYTPAISNPESLEHVNSHNRRMQIRSVNEHVKAERIVVARLGGSAVLYDQFLNRLIQLDLLVSDDELSAVINLAKRRTLVYVNRPKDAQDLAARLGDRRGQAQLSIEAQKAIYAIGDLIDPNYSLIRAIRSGVLFHHGQIPDILRQYIEHLFREDSSLQRRLLVTTSTLLEGINTPADCLIMMTPSRGRRHLSRSAFRNLIGRVARFREVFDSSRNNLGLLQPRIYLIPSSYANSNWNVEKFLENVADLAKTVEDNVDNPLLERAQNSNARQEALEYLENIEPGTSQLPSPRTAITEVGRLCFQNGVHDFDIFLNEREIQNRVETIRIDEGVLKDASAVVETICFLFFDGIELVNADDLKRLRDTEGARSFYKMFLGWRTQNKPFKILIQLFVSYWKQLDEGLVYVGSKWGEEVYGEVGRRKLYVRMKSKTEAEMINLAVVKIKEEQDFVDFNLLKYIEIMNSLEMIEHDLYYKIKFGTADPYMICLLQNGFSSELARLVQENYSDFIKMDFTTSEVSVRSELPRVMASYDENDILVYEAKTLVNVELSE